MKTFGDVMERLPFDRLFQILRNPQEVDHETLLCMDIWMRATFVMEGDVGRIMLATKASDSLTFARRKIQEGAVKWNGQKVADIKTPVDFIRPGWGILQVGKKSFWMVLSPDEEETFGEYLRSL